MREFCTKLSDTCASEIGKAYGKHTFLITTLQPVPRGTEGAVSLEGTIAGIVGSILIAFLSWAVGLIDLTGVVFCIIAAFIATNIESVIGATVQSKFEWLTNEVVNFFNTLIGAICAIVWLRCLESFFSLVIFECRKLKKPGFLPAFKALTQYLRKTTRFLHY